MPRTFFNDFPSAYIVGALGALFLQYIMESFLNDHISSHATENLQKKVPQRAPEPFLTEFLNNAIGFRRGR